MGRGAQGFVIVVDMSQKKSLNTVETFVQEIYAKADVEQPVIMILANKRDLDPSKKQITNKEIQDFQRTQEEQCLYFEVRARNNINITEAFTEMSEHLLVKGQ